MPTLPALGFQTDPVRTPGGLQRLVRNNSSLEKVRPGVIGSANRRHQHNDSSQEATPKRRRRNSFSVPPSEVDDLSPDVNLDFDGFIDGNGDEGEKHTVDDSNDAQEEVVKNAEIDMDDFPLLQGLGYGTEIATLDDVKKSDTRAFMAGCEKKLQDLMDQFEGPIKAYGHDMGVLRDAPYDRRGDEQDPVAVRLRTLTILNAGQQALNKSESTLEELGEEIYEDEPDRDPYECMGDEHKKRLEWSETRIDEVAEKKGHLYAMV